ncbi:hypothetical protein [Frankia sp. AgKG'84/4]
MPRSPVGEAGTATLGAIAVATAASPRVGGADVAARGGGLLGPALAGTPLDVPGLGIPLR